MYEVAKGGKATGEQRIVPRDGAIFQSMRDTPAAVRLDVEVAKIFEARVDYSLRV